MINDFVQYLIRFFSYFYIFRFQTQKYTKKLEKLISLVFAPQQTIALV